MSDEVEYKFVKGQGWVAQYPKPEPDPWAKWREIAIDRSTRYYLDGANWLTTDAAWHTGLQTYYNQFQQHPSPPPTTPQEPLRYFPGSNTPAERVESTETVQERRVREYREAVRRFGRR